VPYTDASPNAIAISDSKQNLKESSMPVTCSANTMATTTTVGLPTATTALIPANHLELPLTNNPNLLSPDVLNQKRSRIKISFN